MLFIAGLAAVLGAGALYQFFGGRRSARVYPPPGRMIDAAGQRLHVVCAGAGEPAVVFESGIAASSLSWSRVLPDVASFTRACAYDRAGLGWSDPARAARTLDRMLDEMHGVIQSVAPAAPSVLVGHSFGGFLVSAYASKHPGAVAGLVLLDPPSDWHEIDRRQAHILWGGVQLSRIGGVLARVGVVRACLALLTSGAPAVPRNFVRVFGPTAARTLERLVGEVRKLPPDVHPVVQAIWCQPKCFRAMAEHFGALEQTAAFISRITSLGDLPLVVISSGDQGADTVDRHRKLAQLSTDGRHIVADRSDHWIPFDEPELVVRVVKEMVDRAPRR